MVYTCVCGVYIYVHVCDIYMCIYMCVCDVYMYVRVCGVYMCICGIYVCVCVCYIHVCSICMYVCGIYMCVHAVQVHSPCLSCESQRSTLSAGYVPLLFSLGHLPWADDLPVCTLGPASWGNCED